MPYTLLCRHGTGLGTQRGGVSRFSLHYLTLNSSLSLLPLPGTPTYLSGQNIVVARPLRGPFYFPDASGASSPYITIARLDRAFLYSHTCHELHQPVAWYVAVAFFSSLHAFQHPLRPLSALPHKTDTAHCVLCCLFGTGWGLAS